MSPSTQTIGPLPQRSISTLAELGRGGLALGLALLATANIVTALVVKPWAAAVLGEHVMDLDSLGWGRTNVVLLSTLLLLVARALARGKRQAWWLSLGIVGLSALSTLRTHAHFPIFNLSLTFLLALVALAPLFSRRSDPYALRRGYVAFAVAVGCLLMWHQVLVVWHFGLVPHAWLPYRRSMNFTLEAVILLAVAYGVREVLRPVREAPQRAQDERECARALVRQYGMSTSAHFAIGEDKSFFFADTGQAFMAYRLVRKVALVLGDPVGPEDESKPLLQAFVSYCRKQDWAVAWYLATPRLRDWCRGLGMRAYKVGEEATLDLDRFSTAGKDGAPVRHAVTRARKGGMSVHCWQGEHVPDDIFAGMQRVSREWQADHRAHIQMGFSMGRFPADWSHELLTAVACDADGEVQAFLTWTPFDQGCGWALDVMRRAHAAAPGTMELLIVESVGWARAHGYRRISLGLAPLAGMDAKPDDSGILAAEDDRHRALERIAGSLHRRKVLLGHYSTLWHFKAKFRPTWEPRYLIVADRLVLPQALSALMGAMGYSWKSAVRDARRGARPPELESVAKETVEVAAQSGRSGGA